MAPPDFNSSGSPRIGTGCRKNVAKNQQNASDRPAQPIKFLEILYIYRFPLYFGNARSNVVKRLPFSLQARQIKQLIAAGFGKQILVSHDHSPFYYPKFSVAEKRAADWKQLEPDYTTVTTKLVAALKELDVTPAEIRGILIENPQRALAF